MNYKQLSVFTFLFLMLSVSFVSASINWGINTQNFIYDVTDVISPVTELLFGEERTTGENGAMSILAFALVMLIIFGVLSPLSIFGDNKWINAGIAFIISVIGVRFMPIGFLESLTTPASALVATTVLVVPMVILFFITIKINNSGVRRAIWAVYGAVVLMLLFINWQAAESSGFYWVYVLIGVACFAVFWWDGIFKKWSTKAAIGRNLASANDIEQERLTMKIGQLNEAIASEPSSIKRAGIQKQINDLKKRLADLQKNM